MTKGRSSRDIRIFLLFLGKTLWYTIKPRKSAPILVPDLMWDRNFAVWNNAGAFVTHAFYEITPNDEADVNLFLGILNSTLAAMFEEVWGRTALGEGAIRMMAHEWQSMPIPNPEKINQKHKKAISNAFLKLCNAVREDNKELEKTIREQLDDEVFESIGLTSNERREIIDGLDELKKMRKRRINPEVLIKHPETKKRIERKKSTKDLRVSENSLDKWVV